MSSSGEIYPWYAWSTGDVIMQVTGGTLSTVSSALILYIIFRSREKLSSTYHRIMSILSASDILWSFALALITIPSPKTYVPFKGPMLGTQATCVAQGFLISVGSVGAVHMSVCLAWYYALVALRVDKLIIRNYYETIFYIYSILANVGTAWWLLVEKQFNIRFWSNYCGISPIDTSCFYFEGPDPDAVCTWPESPHTFFFTKKMWKWTLIVSFILIVLAMLVVIVVVFRNERYFVESKNSRNNNRSGNADDHWSTRDNDHDEVAGGEQQQNENKENELLPLKHTRLIASQAIMYILAFLLSWVMIVITLDMDFMPAHIGKLFILLLFTCM